MSGLPCSWGQELFVFRHPLITKPLRDAVEFLRAVAARIVALGGDGTNPGKLFAEERALLRVETAVLGAMPNQTGRGEHSSDGR